MKEQIKNKYRQIILDARKVLAGADPYDNNYEKLQSNFLIIAGLIFHGSEESEEIRLELIEEFKYKNSN